MAWHSVNYDPANPQNGGWVQPRNPRALRITILKQNGLRPRYSPDGSKIVYDALGLDSLADVYVMSATTGLISLSVTAGRAGIGQGHNGNATFLDNNTIVFASEELPHYPVTPDYHSFSDPGLGGYCNFYAAKADGTLFSNSQRFVKLTNTPIKQNDTDGIPNYANGNPLRGAYDGKLYWNQRYVDISNTQGYGGWRLMRAPVTWTGDMPSLGADATFETVYTPYNHPQGGWYILPMAQLSATRLIVGGNLDNQPSFWTSQYTIDFPPVSITSRNSQYGAWEEGSAASPDGTYVAVMTNAWSPYRFDLNNPSWQTQPMTREFYLTNVAADAREQLTFFNDPTAAEWAGVAPNGRTYRVTTPNPAFSPDSGKVAGVLALDDGDATTRRTAFFKIFEVTLDPTAPPLGALPALPAERRAVVGQRVLTAALPARALVSPVAPR